MSAQVFTSFLETPLGWMRFVSNGAALLAAEFLEGTPAQDAQPDAVTESAQSQMAEYFAGARTEFDLPLAPEGTEFRQKVWRELARIPFGETASYLDLAKRLQQPDAIRAVGTANGANPLAILLPCHRIIGSDGSLTGYAGGLWRKRWLLDHEKKTAGKGQLQLFS